MDRTRWDALADGSVTIPVNEQMGFAPDFDSNPDEISFSWIVPDEYCNSVGGLQGGVLAAFADAVLGAATATRLPADKYPALAALNISIFRPAAPGATLRGKGRVLKAGRRVVFAEASITDSDGSLIAKASGTEIPTDA